MKLEYILLDKTSIPHKNLEDLVLKAIHKNFTLPYCKIRQIDYCRYILYINGKTLARAKLSFNQNKNNILEVELYD